MRRRKNKKALKKSKPNSLTNRLKTTIRMIIENK